MPDGIDQLGTKLAEALAPKRSDLVTVSYGTVKAVNETEADVRLDVDLHGGTLYGLPMTTACKGVAVGDRVIVQTYGHLSTVTGVIAHDNSHYVKVLKSGIVAYMQGGQTELLPEPISKQPHGIVLHWSGFSESGFVDYARNHYQFIPKTHVDNETYAGTTVQEVMGHGPTLCYKTLYVYDDRLVGIDENTGTCSGSGVTYNNSAFVLREIISV